MGDSVVEFDVPTRRIAVDRSAGFRGIVGYWASLGMEHRSHADRIESAIPEQSFPV